MGSIVGRSLAVLAVLAGAAALGGSVHAAAYAKGIDVSHWNGAIDWLQVADDGYTFLFAKATESTTFTDVTYGVNRLGTQGLGLRLGAYHFARPAGTSDAAVTASAIAQADHFVAVAQPKTGDLPPVLDLEANGGLSQSRLVQWTQAWLDEVLARTGASGLVYASPSFWKTSLGDTTIFAGNGHRLWIAHWTKNPSPLVPASNWGGLGWSFWQWTNCTSVPGIAHCSDGDRANGPSVLPFTLPAAAKGAPTPNAPPTVVGAARAGALLAGVPGTWDGGKPVAFTYQWLRCDAAGSGCGPIPGATLETYTPSAADVGHALVLSVIAATAAGTATAAAAPTLPVAPPGSGASARPAALTAPQVAGTPQVGQTLTASAGTWSGSPTSFAYQWRRCDAAGAACTAASGGTRSSYTVTPGDLGVRLSLVVTATGPGGSQAATAPTTAAVVPAPVPAPVAGSLAAQAGLAGAVVTNDGRATVTWQPGAVPVGTVVSLEAVDGAPAVAHTGVSLTLAPAVKTLPWPVDVAYAAAPAGQIVGFSADGRVWLPVGTLTAPTLPAGLSAGVYLDGSALHVLTRRAGRIALFRSGRWGDPRRISSRPPVLRRLTRVRVVRLGRQDVLLSTRLSTSSQAHLYGTVLRTRGVRPAILQRGSRFAVPLGRGTSTTVQTLVLGSGGFPVRLRLSGRGLTRGALVRIQVRAIDPWGRRGAFTLSFRAP